MAFPGITIVQTRSASALAFRWACFLHCQKILFSTFRGVEPVTPPPLNTALIRRKRDRETSLLFTLPNRLIHMYVHPCIPDIPLVPSDSPTLISSLLRLFAHHLALAVAAPKIWNSFPLSLRTCTSPDTFRRHLKTHYCKQAFQST